MKTQNTHTPWIVTKGNVLDNIISEKNGSQTIAETRNLQGNAKANAAHIVKCVNLHDALVFEAETALADTKILLAKAKVIVGSGDVHNLTVKVNRLKDLLKRAKVGV